MSSKQPRCRTAADDAGWLSPHRDVFLHGLDKHGYAPSTIRYYRRAIDSFCTEIAARRIGAKALEESLLAKLRNAAPAGLAPKEKRRWSSCVGSFIEHLADVGVLAPLAPADPPSPGSLDHLSMEYADWLRHQRGLRESTISRHQAFLKRFMRDWSSCLTGRGAGEALEGVRREAVRQCLCDDSR